MSDNSDIRLISLETGGNQAYIFATNKLRNVVGASELLYRVGTSYVERAVYEATGRSFRVDEILKEPRIEDDADTQLEVVVATSGKAMLLARDGEIARRFVTAWSRMVVTEAPGLDAIAVFSDHPVDPKMPLSDRSSASYLGAFRETERNMSKLRMSGCTSPMRRFQRLPIVADCAFSGMPASVRDQSDQLISASLDAQRSAVMDEEHVGRMRDLHVSINTSSGLSSLERCAWLAVVHADGNGLGQLFINFDELVSKYIREHQKRDACGRDYIDLYRKFSSALDRISRSAFSKTIDEVWPDQDQDEKRPLIVPIVVGGDDLTAVMDGEKSIGFAERFMTNFCKGTKDNSDVSSLLSCVKDNNMPRLGMCAGISIAKPHFPFSLSYRMAEELMKNAKQVKNKFGKDSIALDFHILYDSISTSIGDIRRKLVHGTDGEVVLTAKPYVVEHCKAEDPEMRDDDAWKRLHSFGDFKKAVRALKIKTDKSLPSSQSHSVRESLFSEDIETQEAEWRYLLNTYSKFADAWREVHGDRLYIDAHDDEGKKYFTYFLDALEAARFMPDTEAASKEGDER